MMIAHGEIYYANLDPTIGSEISKTRPVIIVSNNASNLASATVTIVPITSRIDSIYPFEVFLPQDETSLKLYSKAQCHQVRTISKKRLSGPRAGEVSKSKMALICEALKLHLNIV